MRNADFVVDHVETEHADCVLVLLPPGGAVANKVTRRYPEIYFLSTVNRFQFVVRVLVSVRQYIPWKYFTHWVV